MTRRPFDNQIRLKGSSIRRYCFYPEQVLEMMKGLIRHNRSPFATSFATVRSAAVDWNSSLAVKVHPQFHKRSQLLRLGEGCAFTSASSLNSCRSLLLIGVSNGSGTVM